MEEYSYSRVAVRTRPKPRFDPVIVAAIALIMAVVGWSALPDAAALDDSKDLGIELSVDPGVAVVPAFTTPGSTALELDDITVPGQIEDATSTGWSLTNNSWFPGYAVTMRSVSDPALRGKNAVDGNGVSDSFNDFSTGAGCPCSWDVSTSTKGVFGFSVTGSSNFVNSSSWGTAGALKYRGFTTNDFTIASQTGLGAYSWTLYVRSELPEKALQQAGSYRAKLIMSIAAQT